MSKALTADEVITHLGLKPHPEGGWYRETFRDERGHAGRAHSTAILYLLKAGEVGRWHRVDAAEVWHWYGGAPLLLEVKEGDTRRRIPAWVEPTCRRASASVHSGRRLAGGAEPGCLDACGRYRGARLRLCRLRDRPGRLGALRLNP
jgi:Cupin superfamily (DUF985)